MKHNSLFFLVLSWSFFFCSAAFAQISYGGRPINPPILREGALRSAVVDSAGTNSSFGGMGIFEMPAIDLDSVMREDPAEEGNNLRSYRFAHKFFTKIEKKKDAALTVLPDGTKVWQIHIHSRGANSINVLLTDFELPPGGKLFAYNSPDSTTGAGSLTHVIGSFDYRNNSPERILPLRPVAGESITIEYSEPVDVPFEGKFTVSEVNHDYRGFFRREPDIDDTRKYSCMPDALCSEADEHLIRSTVLLIIDGTIACTGVLVNNTNNDSTPYILTAVHCLNDSLEYGISRRQDHYISTSGTVITFFNYNRPICGTQLKGTEEMTVAQAYPRIILEQRDVALLELREKPPVYYNAYYAGWNMSESESAGTHSNLHHPAAAVKKYGQTDADLSVVTYPSRSENFETMVHWKVPAWTTGSTHGGSSGSPLFDKNGLVVGTLTGGTSECRNGAPNGSDYFTILYKSWKMDNSQLKTYLDPGDKGWESQSGFDPNHENPLIRLSNMDFSAGDALVVSNLKAPNAGFVYGSNNMNTIEFAEKFTVENAVEILGVYLFVPPLPANGVSSVEISVYSGETSPERLLQTQAFSPKYLNYTASDFSQQDKDMKSAGTETFVLFEESIKIAKGNFFISYTVNGTNSFCVYNAKFANANKQNTAWVKDPSQGWIQADVYLPAQTEKTSLAIQPLVRNTKPVSTETPEKADELLFFYAETAELRLREPVDKPVSVNIYSLTGMLMEAVRFDKGEKSVFLTKKARGSIGIVRLILSNKGYSKKIIY